MLTPKLIPMEKMEQLEKARTKEQQAKGLEIQTIQAAPNEAQMDRAEELYREGGGVRGDEEYGPHVEAEKRGGGGVRAKRAIRAVQKAGPTKGFTSPEERPGSGAKRIRDWGRVTGNLIAPTEDDPDTLRYEPPRFRRESAEKREKAKAATKKAGLEYAPKMEKQRLDAAAVQLEKIFGFRDRKKKDAKVIDFEDRGGYGSQSYRRARGRAKEDRERVARQRQQVKDVAAAPGKAAGKAAGAAAGAAYEATGAAERGAKKAGSALARAFGAGKRKVKEAAGAPGRRREAQAAERGRIATSQQATRQRVAASEARRDDRKQRAVIHGPTGYANGGARLQRTSSKAQQSDINRGAAAAREKAASYKSPRERAAEAKPSPSPSPSQGGRDPLSAYKNPPQSTGGRSPSYGSGAKDPLSAYKAGARSSQPTPKQQPTKADPTKPVWGQNMEKAVISLQKFLDDCGCDDKD